MKSVLDTELQEKDALTIVGISSNGKITYNIVDNEGSFSNTGISIIRRLRQDKNQFIADMYVSQSYLSIKYLFDTKIIYSTQEKLQNNTNVTNFDRLLSLIEEENLIENIYIYDIEEDILITKLQELDNKFIALDYKDLSSIKEFIEENDLETHL
jgi:hypothetical protein